MRVTYLLTIFIAVISGALLSRLYFKVSESAIITTSNETSVQPAAKALLSKGKLVSSLVDASESTLLLQQENQQLKQQISTLSETITAQQAQLLALQQANATRDNQSIVYFENLLSLQKRDESWAYQVESAIQDFVATADLYPQLQLDELGCKATVCQFTLTHDLNDGHDLYYWRNVNDFLLKQPWWQQFNYTLVINNNNQVTYTISTK
ncbi:hypothetical protein J8L70_01965 [Pseudoalteromonas sp. MMG010]|uniref:hypothetical protein n=1 Tax=Pseudoalteromonas sp. MMG010 TaxID=2822685 RepID=UPI001B3A47E8|nr:hypothetical protein [Pseudoalteromonas sp. MMG010]MBQ4831997.1 hypothetical protein [Pseudoalteromonas sp. MMG010]